LVRLDTRGPVAERYQILGRIGSGAMGQIFVARVRTTDGKAVEVALKRLKPELQKDQSFVTMFFDEARVASKLDHPNVIRMLELGELDGSLFYSMELVPGINLADILRDLTPSGQRIPIEVVADIACQLLDALEYAHEFADATGQHLAIVHRDVSPQNVLVGFDGVVKLLDFGVTKAVGQLHKTSPGMVKGKLAYMAPEQIRGEPVDRRTDLFALGVVMYEASVFRHPFFGKTDPEVITAIMRAEPPHPSAIDPKTPGAFAEILLRAIEKEVERRFADARAMRAALTAFLESRRQAPSIERIQRFMRLHFRDRIEELARARWKKDDVLLIRALEVKRVDRSKRPESDPRPPVLLAPPPLAPPPLLGSGEASSDGIAAPTIRRRSSVETGDLPTPGGAVGDRMGRYVLLQRLRSAGPAADGAPAGGRREMYRAKLEGEAFEKRYLLARLAEGATEADREAFVEGVRFASELGHAGLVPIFELAFEEDRPFAVMELVEGWSLDHLLDRVRSRKARMPVAIGCRVVADLARTIHQLHDETHPDGRPRTILHRDLCPERILVSDAGEVRIADLSSAREVGAAERRDSQPPTAYSAPERHAGSAELPESDVFSLGAILFECISSVSPFARGSPEAVRRAILEERPPPLAFDGLALPAGLVEIVARALAKRPSDRPSARALALMLEASILTMGQPVTSMEVADWARQFR
jgi:serine/threonine protein kinase